MQTIGIYILCIILFILLSILVIGLIIDQIKYGGKIK